MRRSLLLLALFLLVPRLMAAQTLTQTASASWHMVETPTQVTTMNFALYNSNVLTGTAPNQMPTPGPVAPVCAAAAAPGSGTDCTATVPANMQPAVGGNYAVCARFTTGVSMSCSDSTPTGPPAPGKPGSLAIQIILKWQ